MYILVNKMMLQPYVNNNARATNTFKGYEMLICIKMLSVWSPLLRSICSQVDTVMSIPNTKKLVGMKIGSSSNDAIVATKETANMAPHDAKIGKSPITVIVVISKRSWKISLWSKMKNSRESTWS